jgi:arylsulfatase A-like enzyme
MPTLLTLVRVAIPKSVDGLDFSTVMRGGKDPSGGATVIRCVSPFGEYMRRNGGREYRAVRTADHTYARTLEGPWLLYDNEADPYQTNNLVGTSGHRDLQAHLDTLLTQKLSAQRDDFRSGPEYIRKWNYKVDANETAIYMP